MKEDSIVEVHIEEYKSLRDDILKRTEFQERIINYNIIIIGAFFAFLGSHETPKQYNFLILITPLIFYALGWLYAINDNSTVQAAKYINKYLRPKLIKLLDDPSLLGYENYLYEDRTKFKKSTFGKIYTSIQSIFSVIIPTCILLYFGYINEGFCHLRKLEIFLVLVDIILGIGTVLIRFKFWNYNYRSIVH